jgi:hypothetical protein
MRKHPRTLLIALLTVAAILGLLVASACGEEKPTGTMTELKLTGEAGGTATAYVYSPTNPDFPGTVMPITFVYPDKTVASADEALKYLVKTGIKDILEKNRTFGMVFTPIDTAGYTEARASSPTSALSTKVRLRSRAWWSALKAHCTQEAASATMSSPMGPAPTS